jgi:hypothetical protein
MPKVASELQAIAGRLEAPGRTTRPERRQRELNRIEQARARAQTLFIDGVITRERLDQELARFGREVAALPDSPALPSRQNSRHLQAVARSLEEHWATWSNESKRELLQEMIQYIVLNRSDLAASEIVWKSVV